MRRLALACLSVIAAVAFPATSRAAMVDLSRLSVVTVSTYGGSLNPGSFYHSESTTSLDSWYVYIQSSAGAFGSASQTSWLNDSVISMNGHSAIAGGAGNGGGQAPSLMTVAFTIQEYHTFSYVGEVTQASFGYATTRLTRIGGPTVIDSGFNINREWTGMLEPGRYELSTQLNCSDISGFFYGGAIFTVTSVPSPVPAALFGLFFLRPLHRRR